MTKLGHTVKLMSPQCVRPYVQRQKNDANDYGDNIPEKPTANPGQDQWRVRLAMARLWAHAVNRRGGDVTVVHLPEIGIRGNTHFPFSDLNNLEIADLLTKFLETKGLD